MEVSTNVYKYHQIFDGNCKETAKTTDIGKQELLIHVLKFTNKICSFTNIDFRIFQLLGLHINLITSWPNRKNPVVPWTNQVKSIVIPSNFLVVWDKGHGLFRALDFVGPAEIGTVIKLYLFICLSKSNDVTTNIICGFLQEIEMVIQRLEEETAIAREECERAAENRIK